MWRKGSNNYAKTFFFSIYFQFLFLTSFHVVGSKSWDSFTLLSMKVPIQISQIFWGGRGRITQEQEPSWAPDSEEPNYRYPLVISCILTEKWATHFLHFDLTVWWCCVAFSHTPTYEIPTHIFTFSLKKSEKGALESRRPFIYKVYVVPRNSAR